MSTVNPSRCSSDDDAAAAAAAAADHYTSWKSYVELPILEIVNSYDNASSVKSAARSKYTDLVAPEASIASIDLETTVDWSDITSMCSNVSDGYKLVSHIPSEVDIAAAAAGKTQAAEFIDTQLDQPSPPLPYNAAVILSCANIKPGDAHHNALLTPGKVGSILYVGQHAPGV